MQVFTRNFHAVDSSEVIAVRHVWSDGWKSNLPDAYRGDLTSDGEYKNFAIGSANGEEGQRTVRPRNARERGYCTARGGGDKYCFFDSNFNTIQEYVIENVHHRVQKRWE